MLVKLNNFDGIFWKYFYIFLYNLHLKLYILNFSKSMTEDNRFDGILMSIIQQKGNIDGFFDSVFGFLRRNTDFFVNQKKAE